MSEIDLRPVRLVDFETGEYFDVPYGELCSWWNPENPQRVRDFISLEKSDNNLLFPDEATFERARARFSDYIAEQVRSDA